MAVAFLLFGLIARVAGLRAEECDRHDLSEPTSPVQEALEAWAAGNQSAEAPSLFQGCISAVLGAPRRKDTPALETVFKGCPDAGKLFGALVKGVQDAGFLKSADWSLDGVLTVELTADKIYGEIASASKLAIMWKLKSPLTFAVKPGEYPWQSFAAVTGVEMMFPVEGTEVYLEATEGQRCTREEIDGIKTAWATGKFDLKKSCIQREMTAAGKFLPGWYKSVKGGSKDAERKLTRIMKDMYGTTATYTAVNIGGPYMSSEWPKVFYSLITPQPGQLTLFTFNDEAAMDKLPKAEKKAVLAAHKPGVKVIQGHPEDFHDENSLGVKTEIVGYKSLGDAQKTLPIAEKAARSGMAFAEMVMWGKFEDLLLKVNFPHMAPIGALMNMFSYCDEGDVGLAETKDPGCSGKTIGRVSWATKPSHRFG